MAMQYAFIREKTPDKPMGKPRAKPNAKSVFAKELVEHFPELVKDGDQPFSEWSDNMWRSWGKAVNNQSKEISKQNWMEFNMFLKKKRKNRDEDEDEGKGEEKGEDGDEDPKSKEEAEEVQVVRQEKPTKLKKKAKHPPPIPFPVLLSKWRHHQTLWKKL